MDSYKLIGFVSFLFLFFSCNQKQSKLQFIKSTHNFDSIYPTDKAYVYFVYENKGNSNLVINNIDYLCGCTLPYYSDAPLLPNERDSILVEFDNKTNKGYFVKEIIVNSNDPMGPHKLYIKGFAY
jgi:hypothetical protein